MSIHYKKITFSATSQKITIDWGDVTVEDIVPNGVERAFSHEYENATVFQTISVNTEDLTKIGFGYESISDNIYELRFGNCAKLKEIELYNSYYSPYSYVPNLIVFEINKAESLVQLEICGTNLASLNLNGCTNLTELYCSDNHQLTSLDISKCTMLITLYCSNNQLTSLDISKCTELRWLDCSRNQLSVSALNSLFTGLPVRTSYYGSVNCGGNPGYDSCDKNIAENKGWDVYNFY